MSYDAFLSHNRADKEWVRSLHDSLARHDYNGRNLRVWLDEQVLDPGLPSSNRELNSALDRSRFLIVVLSPEAVASPWVEEEIAYFLSIREARDVVLVRHRATSIPAALEGAPLIEWSGPVDDKACRAALIELVCPAGDFDEYSCRVSVRRAWQRAFHRQPEGFDPTPTPENSKLLDLLLSHDIDDLAQEGPALVGFDRLGDLLSDVDGAEHYGSKMVVGEFLALAMLRSSEYRRVGARYVDREAATRERPTFNQTRKRLLQPRLHVGPGTNLAFSVARAGSKLAEIEPALVDLSTLWAVLHGLDQRDALANDERALSMMIGRTLGKLRNTPLVDVLIHSLAQGRGAASRFAAGVAISANYTSEEAMVYYTQELAEVAAATPRPPLRDPSQSTAQLLLDGALCDPIDPHLKNMREEFEQVFGSNWPTGPGLEPVVSHGPVATHSWNGPLVGRVRRVTVANMEAVADGLGPTDVACLVEPRVVDALLSRAGGFVVEEQQADTPLCQRLLNRGSRLAMLARPQLDALADGDCITIPVSPTGDRSRGFMIRAAGV